MERELVECVLNICFHNIFPVCFFIVNGLWFQHNQTNRVTNILGCIQEWDLFHSSHTSSWAFNPLDKDEECTFGLNSKMVLSPIVLMDALNDLASNCVQEFGRMMRNKNFKHC